MESAPRPASRPQPLVVRGHGSSSWTRTVAVIRVPRLNLLGALRPVARHTEDPLEAFTTEAELRSPRR